MGLSDKLDNVMDMIEHSQLSREPRRMSLMVKIAGLALLFCLAHRRVIAEDARGNG